jgi:hypothetical protein
MLVGLNFSYMTVLIKMRSQCRVFANKKRHGLIQGAISLKQDKQFFAIFFFDDAVMHMTFRQALMPDRHVCMMQRHSHQALSPRQSPGALAHCVCARFAFYLFCSGLVPP